MAIEQTDFGLVITIVLLHSVSDTPFLKVYYICSLHSVSIRTNTSLAVDTVTDHCFSIHKWWDTCTLHLESQKIRHFPLKIHASVTFSILQSDLSKTQELSKIGFWREIMLWDWSKIFFNCSSSLEISVESLELGLCKVLSKLTSEIRETTLVTILWMRLSLRVARARAEQWGRPRHHSTSIPLVTPSSPKPPPLLFLFSEVVSSVLRGCSFCCCEKKVLSPPKRGQLSLFGCLHFPLLLALVLGPVRLLFPTFSYCQLQVRPRASESDFCAILAWLQQ